MSQEDQIKLLTKIDTNLSIFMNRFDEHEKKDEKRFMWLGICLLIIAAATGVLPQIMTHIKL